MSYILFDSTWTAWSNVCNDKNHVLIIGVHTLRTQGSGTFTEANHFHEVFVALGLMLNLMLEAYFVLSSDFWVTNSLMKLIKDSSAPNISSPISSNSFGKVNKSFCRFVIDMLSVQLVFDNWYHLLLRVHPPLMSRTLPKMSFCEPSIFSPYLLQFTSGGTQWFHAFCLQT